MGGRVNLSKGPASQSGRDAIADACREPRGSRGHSRSRSCVMHCTDGWRAAHAHAVVWQWIRLQNAAPPILRSSNDTAGETVITALAVLWLPSVVGAVFVFIASSIIHMGPFWHRNDFPKLPDEEKLRAAVGPLAIPPGDYMIPRCDNMAEMRSPEFVKKMA